MRCPRPPKAGWNFRKALKQRFGLLLESWKNLRMLVEAPQRPCVTCLVLGRGPEGGWPQQWLVGHLQWRQDHMVPRPPLQIHLAVRLCFPAYVQQNLLNLNYIITSSSSLRSLC